MPDISTKAFPTAHVLSVITGRLMGDIGGVYTVLNWMAGESVCTHQIPRIGREAQAAMIAFRPDLQQAIDEAEQVSSDNYLDWLAIWAARYGDAIAVVKLNADQHERIDPIFELAEMIMPDRIVAVLARSDAALREAREDFQRTSDQADDLQSEVCRLRAENKKLRELEQAVREQDTRHGGLTGAVRCALEALDARKRCK